MNDQHRALVSRSAPIIWRACATLAGAEQAERLTIRTFQRALRERDARDVPPAPIGWLLGIVRIVCAGEQDVAPASSRHGTAEQPAATLTRHWIDRVLDELPPATREAFLLTALAGFSYIDVAIAYGCSLETVHARVDSSRRCVTAALGASDGQSGASVAW